MASLTPRADKAQKNYIINGDMRIAQRNTSFTSIADSTYNLDRFVYFKTGAMVHNLTQDTDVPTLAQAGHLFQNSLRLNLTTPDTSIAAGDRIEISQIVEGYNWANLAQKPFTLSFWVKATTTGTYCVYFRNAGADRSYIAEYTINATNTWEKKTLNILASDAGGTWNYTNGIGLRIGWTLAAGTTFQTTANAWQSGNFLATANQVNGVNTGATDFRITGVALNEGTLTDPSFSTFGKDFAAEFSACRRYFSRITGTIGLSQSTTTVHQTIMLQPEMRTTPNPGFSGPLQITDQIATDFTQSSGNITTVSLRPAGGRVSMANFTGLTNGRFYTVEPDSETYMTFDAEL